MTTLYTITCGLDTNGHDVDARALILDLAAQAFPMGHTIREVAGRWQLANGETVTEETIEVSWISDEPHEQAWPLVAGVAADYKAGAYQEAVMVTRQPIDATFI